MMYTELQPQYDHTKSFYNKALVETFGNNYILYSYKTKVATYNTSTKKLIVFGLYSMTTSRHVKEFVHQLTGDNLTSKEIMKKYGRDAKC